VLKQDGGLVGQGAVGGEAGWEKRVMDAAVAAADADARSAPKSASPKVCMQGSTLRGCGMVFQIQGVRSALENGVPKVSIWYDCC
jgi:hypothetical protein